MMEKRADLTLGQANQEIKMTKGIDARQNY